MKTATHLPIKQWYESYLRIRRVEERIIDIYSTDKIKSPVHLSIGQEAVSVGICEALKPEDVVFGTYRGHALYLAKGGDLKAMIAELYGKVTGCGRGKAGSMHLGDVDCGMMGTSAVVSTTIPNAVGYAYAMKYEKKPHIAVSFFGDGAVEEGVFFESLNFAALKKLPVLFVCENNKYAIHADQSTRQPDFDLVGRVKSFGIPAERIEDNAIDVIYEKTQACAEKMRAGEGPMFLECMTYRWREHVGPGEDYDMGYRTQEEGDHWVKNDPLTWMSSELSEADRQTIDARVEAELDEAFGFAEDSDFPGEEELLKHLYK